VAVARPWFPHRSAVAAAAAAEVVVEAVDLHQHPAAAVVVEVVAAVAISHRWEQVEVEVEVARHLPAYHHDPERTGWIHRDRRLVAPPMPTATDIARLTNGANCRMASVTVIEAVGAIMTSACASWTVMKELPALNGRFAMKNRRQSARIRKTRLVTEWVIFWVNALFVL